jgi:hypothetical protein
MLPFKCSRRASPTALFPGAKLSFFLKISHVEYPRGILPDTSVYTIGYTSFPKLHVAGQECVRLLLLAKIDLLGGPRVDDYQVHERFASPEIADF